MIIKQANHEVFYMKSRQVKHDGEKGKKEGERFGREGEQHSSERKWRGLILTIGLNQQHL
jgi:hypothetical protein